MSFEINVPTLFLMIIITCLLYAFALGFVNWKDDRDGLRTWSFALCAQAVGYILFGLRGVAWNFLTIPVANALISASYSFFLAAIRDFFDKPKNHVTLWAPPAFIFIFFLFTLGDMRSRLVVGCLVYAMQSLLALRVVLTGELGFKSRGRRLIVLGVCIAAADMLLRSGVGLLSPGDMRMLFQASFTQIVSYIGVFMAIMLVSNGFYMMAKERSDDRLRDVAMKDRLTGAWNRLRIEELGRQEMERLKRYGLPASLIMVDLDHFKMINDRYGHAAGDAALRRFSAIAVEAIRSTDSLGRWGGEEFIIILPSSSIDDARRIAERIRRALEETTFPEGFALQASFGVSACRSGDSWREWLGRADKALYRAKRAGRNLVRSEDDGAPFASLDGDDRNALRTI